MLELSERKYKIIMINTLKSCDRVPMTTLRLSDLLERLPGHGKSIIFMIKFITVKGYKLKSANEMICGASPGENRLCFLVSLPRESHRNTFNFPRNDM